MSPRQRNADVGASFVLSFVIVGLVAVALRPEEPGSSPATLAEPRPGPDQDRPSAAPIARRDEVGSTPSRPAEGRPPARTTSAEGPKVVRPASRRPAPRRSASSFTQVADGETLADVADRVYGSPDAVRSLWLANRDQLERPDAPLRAGTLLRTP